MSKEVIVCKNMSKTFDTSRGAVHVIDDVTLNVHENELLVLFGPGQCGKSTMINCMSGLESVSGGLVEVSGKKVSKPGPDRGVVYISVWLFFPGLPLWEMWNMDQRCREWLKRSAGRRPAIILIWLD